MTKKSSFLLHEEMAHETRQWVRLTRTCNNRCVFCLDDPASAGGLLPEQEILDEIAAGRRRGAARLILSGGEPTIHPAFVRFIRRARLAGYRHIQTVTNGRMFSYPAFIERCIAAGLDEITFSIHGPDAAVHDALVGVAGAFSQTVQGLGLALASGRIVVSVDVCLNRRNIRHLPEILDRFIAAGVTEFDLLHIIPFGRAFDDCAGLVYDLEEARPYLQRALQISLRPGVHIWFNRFPAPHLEGFEHLIQDPHKLHDEVRGRREELEEMLDSGDPLRCRQPERCARCYLRLLCDTLEELCARLERRDFAAYRLHLEPGGTLRQPPWPFARVWVCAADVEAACGALARLDAREVVLELASYEGLERHLVQGRIAGKVLRQARVSSTGDLDSLLAMPGELEVVAYLSGDVAGHLVAAHPLPDPRLVLARRNHARAGTSREWDADLPLFFSLYPSTGAVEDVPGCISGRPSRPGPAVLDAELLRPRPPRSPRASALVDLDGFTSRFIIDHNYSKSLRCRSCIHDPGCQGLQLSYLRAHGYRVLQPVHRPARG